MIAFILALVGLLLALKGLAEARINAPSWQVYTSLSLMFTTLSVAL